MAEKHFEPEDPFAPVAVELSTPGYDGMEAMARCFVEEYALMGWPPERIFRLFTIPEFAGTYSVWEQRGAAYVKDMIAAVMGEASRTALDGAEEQAARKAARDLVPMQRTVGEETHASGL
jgi:hypothetical protein